MPANMSNGPWMRLDDFNRRMDWVAEAIAIFFKPQYCLI